ncbi:Carbohydrate sulfotransferase [Caenorhabditis elegans]|nr:Carbohydrate sulfotransferase [Caenorhabditis elegans]CCD71535.1 Carbohydrate sulfotransferase [Caenorhabditis elegans]|eukprot:NP_001040667.1 Uncharacterized protein CELE_F49D11.3 [Caenorhabditis elegans]
MTQLTMNIMCLLYNETQFYDDNQSLNDTWLTERKCLENDDFIYPTESLENDIETARFAFIRDPIQRFVSLYLNKCVREKSCYNCGDDMRCTVWKIYEGLKKIQDHWDGHSEIGFMEGHAAPLSWNCDFDKDLPKWQLLMMGADSNERKSSILHLANILKKQGVKQELVEKIQEDMIAGETGHSTHKSAERIEAERQVREDPFIRDLLHKIYFFDYVVFPFKRDHLDPKYQSNFWTLPK